MIQDTSAQDTIKQPSKVSKVKRPLILGIAALLVSGLVWSSIGSDSVATSIKRSELRFATLERGTLIRDIPTTGKIVAANAPVLYSPEQGSVTLIAKPGDRVELGDVVASIEVIN